MKLILLLASFVAFCVQAQNVGAHANAPESYSNNLYMIMSSSKFYFNYRHTVNALMIYQYLKKTGITDDQIILMLPSDHGCSPTNLFPGTIMATREHDYNWLCDDVEVDYKAEDLTE
jgi:GPI-anchor transamidase subunit K